MLFALHLKALFTYDLYLVAVACFSESLDNECVRSGGSCVRSQGSRQDVDEHSGETRRTRRMFGPCPCVRVVTCESALAGSLQTRLDLKPRDVAYLQAMGHFDAAPKPLTWRQKLRVLLQALEALMAVVLRIWLV